MENNHSMHDLQSSKSRNHFKITRLYFPVLLIFMRVHDTWHGDGDK